MFIIYKFIVDETERDAVLNLSHVELFDFEPNPDDTYDLNYFINGKLEYVKVSSDQKDKIMNTLRKIVRKQ